MGCCKTKIDLCYLVQETYASPTFNFKDIDVSLDTFIYKTNKLYTCSDEREFEVDFIDNNTVYIVDVDLPISEYNHELLWIRNGIETVVFQGKLTITNKANNCRCGNNKFTFEVINEDVVISVDFEERIIERITDKGPAGDSAYQIAVENGFIGTEAEWLESLKLHYSDLTEAEILELQQPAIEAAQTANTAADNANTATQNAITATNEANTATTNANNAANNANASATNADNSADLATSAATNANNAATAANTAAAFANSQRGWTPIHEFEEDGAQRQVKKLTDYIGGTGDKPTENIGLYVIDGGYTADKSLATNFKGAQGDNLIFEYTHASNNEVYVESIDYDTNTFYAPNHGITGTGRIYVYAFANSNANDLDDLNMLSKVPDGVILTGQMFIHTPTLTNDTFQLTTNASGLGTPIPITNNGTVDLSKWHFETTRTVGFQITGLQPYSDLKIELVGKVFTGGYIYPSGFTETVARLNVTGLVNRQVYYTSNNPTPSVSNNERFGLALGNSNYRIKTEILVNLNGYISQNVSSESLGYIATSPYLSFISINQIIIAGNIYQKKYQATGYTFSGSQFANGTTIKIYKK